MEFKGVESTADSYAQQRRYFGRFDELLDKGGYGPTWLAEPLIAAVVSRSLHYFHGAACILLCYCLMPNHVHLVVSLPDEAQPLVETLQRIKGYTALQANKLLGRTGQFWQRETYDHVVRDGEEMSRIIAYVVNNPVKAGLATDWQDWPHTPIGLSSSANYKVRATKVPYPAPRHHHRPSSWLASRC